MAAPEEAQFKYSIQNKKKKKNLQEHYRVTFNKFKFTGQIAEGEGRHREVALRSGFAFGS